MKGRPEYEPTVMILGAGVMQVPAIRIAREEGMRTLVVDGNAAAPGAGLADRFEVVDLKDLAGLSASARRARESGGLDGVFTAGTDFSASVAYVAEQLGLPGIPYETALDASDKGRMRAVFRRAGVPSPRFAAMDAPGLALERFSDWRFPVVVKPVDNMGARGVVRVDREVDLIEVAIDSLRQSRAGRVVVEEFVEGPEFSIDAVVNRGDIHLCGIADRHIHFPPHFIELGHTMPTAASPVDRARLEAVFRAGVRALGIRAGAAKGDVFLSPDGPVIGEIAARLSGGYMSGWTYPLASGVEPTRAALRIAVGRDPGSLTPDRTWTAAERAFISIPGTVAEVSGEREARAIADVREVFVRAEPGQSVVFPRNNVEKSGNVIAAAATRERAVAAAEAAAAAVFVRLRIDETSTEDFLFGRPRHPFFAIWGDLAAKLAAMPWGLSLGADQAPPEASIRFAKLAVIPLPGIEEFDRPDWNHRTAAETLVVLRRLFPAGADRGRSRPRILLGRVFWAAFVAGGLQGAAWVLDSVTASSTESLALGKIERWSRR